MCETEGMRRLSAGLVLDAGSYIGSNVTLGSGNVTLPGESVVRSRLLRWCPLRWCLLPRWKYRHHGAERAVAESEQLGRTAEVCGLHPLVLLEDDPVPHAERLGADSEFLAQLTGCLAAGPDHVVEGCDIGPPDGQDGGCLVTGGLILRRLGMMDRPPVLDDALPSLVDGAGDGHPAVLGVGLNSGGDVSLPQGNEGIALPLLVGTGLAAVGGEGDHVVAQFGGQRAQCPTGVDGGQLAVVADQDQLRPGCVDIRAELVERACP